MMDHAPLTETQRALMPDLGDDACGFWDLVWLGTGEQHAQEAEPGFARRERSTAFARAWREGGGPRGNHGFPRAKRKGVGDKPTPYSGRPALDW